MGAERCAAAGAGKGFQVDDFGWLRCRRAGLIQFQARQLNGFAQIQAWWLVAVVDAGKGFVVAQVDCRHLKAGAHLKRQLAFTGHAARVFQIGDGEKLPTQLEVHPHFDL